VTSLFFEGFFLQASLILALGAQNVYVLNCGLHRHRHLLVALISSVCDMALIMVGVLGVASVFVQIPLLKIVFGVVGVIFLAYYGFMKLKEAGTFLDVGAFKSADFKQTVLTTLAFSLLNPHVYLDTVVLIGGYSAKFEELYSRLIFGLGAGSFSFIWFFGLASLASLGSRLVHNQKAMRGISLVSGVILLWLAVKLGMDVWGWVRG